MRSNTSRGHKYVFVHKSLFEPKVPRLRDERSLRDGDGEEKKEELIASRADSLALGHFRKRRALILRERVKSGILRIPPRYLALRPLLHHRPTVVSLFYLLPPQASSLSPTLRRPSASWTGN